MKQGRCKHSDQLKLAIAGMACEEGACKEEDRRGAVGLGLVMATHADASYEWVVHC